MVAGEAAAGARESKPPRVAAECGERASIRDRGRHRRDRVGPPNRSRYNRVMQISDMEGPMVASRFWMTRVTTACVVVSALSGCHRPAPSGQVRAIVGGQDITVQDVRAEGRANGLPTDAGEAADKMLLQRVVDRTLLAQSAHKRGLDQTPESPSDLSRLQQVWRADKAVRSLLGGASPPTEAQIKSFITAHPYTFAKRERVSAHAITIAGSLTMFNQLKSFTDFDTASRFLKHLGVPMSEGDGQVDTAQLSPAGAEQVAAAPVGGLLVTQPPGRVQVAKVLVHTLVQSSPQEQMNMAKRALMTEAAAQRMSAELKRLKAETPPQYPADRPQSAVGGGLRPSQRIPS